MATIQAVLFDYGLVLSGPPDPAAWTAMQHVLGVAEQPFADAYWKFRHEYDRGGLNGRTYWAAVASELGQELSPEQLTSLLAEDVRLWTQPNQAMIDWAARLQSAGIKTGILSNIGDAMEDGIVAHAAWLAGFAHHTFSHRLGIAKPELAIYVHAAEGLAAEAGKILFIDDRIENIEAAREAGMQAIQYMSHEQFVSEMQSSGLTDLLTV